MYRQDELSLAVYGTGFALKTTQVASNPSKNENVVNDENSILLI